MPYKNTTPTHLDNFSLFIEKLKFPSLVIFNMFYSLCWDSRRFCTFCLSCFTIIDLFLSERRIDEDVNGKTHKYWDADVAVCIFILFCFLLLLKYYQYHNLYWRPQYQNQNTFSFFTFFSRFLNAISDQNCCVSIASLLFELRNWTENEPKTYERL